MWLALQEAHKCLNETRFAGMNRMEVGTDYNCCLRVRERACIQPQYSVLKGVTQAREQSMARKVTFVVVWGIKRRIKLNKKPN